MLAISIMIFSKSVSGKIWISFSQISKAVYLLREKVIWEYCRSRTDPRALTTHYRTPTFSNCAKKWAINIKVHGRRLPGAKIHMVQRRRNCFNSTIKSEVSQSYFAYWVTIFSQCETKQKGTGFSLFKVKGCGCNLLFWWCRTVEFTGVKRQIPSETQEAEMPPWKWQVGRKLIWRKLGIDY